MSERGASSRPVVSLPATWFDDPVPEDETAPCDDCGVVIWIPPAKEQRAELNDVLCTECEKERGA